MPQLPLEMSIRRERNDSDRKRALQLFRANIHDISPNAVPTRAELTEVRKLIQLKLGVQVGAHPPVFCAWNSRKKMVGAINSHFWGMLVMGEEPANRQSVAKKVRILEQLAVAPEARRQGVASALIAAVEDFHRTEGATLWVGAVDVQDEAALPFYEAEGFTLAGPTGRGIPNRHVELAAQRAYEQAAAGMLNRRAAAWFFKELPPADTQS